MAKDELDLNEVLKTLNSILELELAGVVRYTHYALMVFGHGRLPIVSWMRSQASEAIAHASAAGEHITSFGGHPSLKIGKLLESHQHDIDAILRESISHEKEGIAEYSKLLELVRDRNVMLEEYARKMVHDEEIHVTEVEKMLRRPGKLEPAE
jgi:bacterioferritin